MSSENTSNITDAAKKLYEKLHKEAKAGGYNLNPDVDFTIDLVKGLVINENRYGYRACPCRLASGKKDEDLDIICPCYYRDPDLGDYGTCYCGLYVSEDIVDGNKNLTSIPERRNTEDNQYNSDVNIKNYGDLSIHYPIWRCKVCGYLCARNNPPEVCPICKAKKERFEKLL